MEGDKAPSVALQRFVSSFKDPARNEQFVIITDTIINRVIIIIYISRIRIVRRRRINLEKYLFGCVDGEGIVENKDEARWARNVERVGKASGCADDRQRNRNSVI